MRKIYLFVTLCIVTLAFSQQAHAQGTVKTANERVGELLEEYKTVLNISELQKAQIAPLMLKQFKLTDQLCDVYSNTPQWLDINKQILSLKSQTDSILTAEQRKAKQDWLDKKTFNKKNGLSLYDIKKAVPNDTIQ